MTEKEIENEIKEIIKPHFGHLRLYKKWVVSGEMILEDINEFNTYIRTQKNIIKKLGKPIHKYDSYYRIKLDISKVEKEESVRRLFRNGLNGSSRKFFNKTFEEYKRLYIRLSKDKFKLRVFFRNSSKPHTLDEFLIHLNQSLVFDNDMDDLINDVENNYDYLRVSNGAYLFELTKSLLHIVPTSWCIYQSESDYDREISNRNLHSIWLLIDPCEIDRERKIVGIDVPSIGNELLYMNTLNNRFTDNLPISSTEFFDITKNRLRDRVRDEEINSMISHHLTQLLKEEETREGELEKENKTNPKSLLDIFFQSRI